MFTDEDLKNAARVGERDAQSALTKMAGQNVTINTGEAKIISAEDAEALVGEIDERAVIAYTQAIEGLSGISVLSMERKSALRLVDLLNKRAPGSTIVMKEIDRSTIRETLNIMSNAYVLELAKKTDKLIKLDVPHMVTRGRLSDLASDTATDAVSKVILFNSKLRIESEEFEIHLHFFFLTNE